MSQTIDHRIKRKFSASAKEYDQLSSLHRKIADELLGTITRTNATTLLDVGCGTGYLTGRLLDNFPRATIIGLDFAEGMLKVADSKHNGISWVLADGHHLPFSDRSFDIVVSNLVYQWSPDLDGAFSEARRVLKAGGIFSCTLFGFHTCRELFQSLDEAKFKELRLNRLHDEDKIHQALINSGFKVPKVTNEQIKKTFKDMHGLLAWLKSIGANNLSSQGFLGPEAFIRAASIYREKFAQAQGVEATFEVIKIYAKK